MEKNEWESVTFFCPFLKIVLVKPLYKIKLNAWTVDTNNRKVKFCPFIKRYNFAVS